MSIRRDDISRWILMHKNIDVAELEIIEKVGVVTQVIKTLNTDHAPMGTLNRLQKNINPEAVDTWLRSRAIPASRQNIDKLLRGLSIHNTNVLSLKSYGLSLSDQYWVKPKDSDYSWESINFFQNEFSDDISEILFQNKDADHPNIKIISPDSKTDLVSTFQLSLTKATNLWYTNCSRPESQVERIMCYFCYAVIQEAMIIDGVIKSAEVIADLKEDLR